jgi:hypothetical protein
MDCCVSTSRKARTWLRTAPRTWPRSLKRSIPGPAKPSAGKPQPKPWPNYYGRTRRAQTPVLRRPLESASSMSANSLSLPFRSLQLSVPDSATSSLYRSRSTPILFCRRCRACAAAGSGIRTSAAAPQRLQLLVQSI